MKDLDCAFLRPQPPTRARIVEQPAISTADLVKLWQRAGVITCYPGRTTFHFSPGNLIGFSSIIAAVALCVGYYFGYHHGGTP